MNAARPHVLAFEDSEADDLYDVLARDAACLGEWEIFAPGRDEYMSRTHGLLAEAAAVCSDCPVFNQCSRLAELMEPEAGVWAARLYTPKHPEGIEI